MADWIDELQRWTAEELDYRLEARKMTYIAKSLRRVGGIKIPRVIWSLTTQRLLAMEYLEGRWLSNEHASLNKAELSHAASLLFQAFLYQIFEVGVFNADLHKGNLCLFGRRQGWHGGFRDNRLCVPADAPTAFGPCYPLFKKARSMKPLPRSSK